MGLAKRIQEMCAAGVMAFACLLPAQDAGAIVNIENLRIGMPEQGFDGNIELALSENTGTLDRSETTVGARLAWQYDRHTDFVVSSYAHAAVADLTRSDKSFLHLGHITRQTPFYALEGYVQAERDEFTRLSLRRLIGAGTRLTLIERPDRVETVLGLGGMYVAETLIAQAGTNDRDSEQQWRANSYLVLKYRLGEGMMLVNSTYYQPALRGTGDYRALDTLALQIRIDDHFAIQLGVNAVHDSRPPETVDKTDVSYRVGISGSL